MKIKSLLRASRLLDKFYLEQMAVIKVGRAANRSDGCCFVRHESRRRKSGLVRKNGWAANMSAKGQNYAAVLNNSAMAESSFVMAQRNCVEAQSNSAMAES